MREARFGVGSVLVDEGAAPTMVFVIVEGECRIIKTGKPRSLSEPAGESDRRYSSPQTSENVYQRQSCL